MSDGVSCPDPEMLRHLAAGQLSKIQADSLNEHVQQCPSCTQLLSIRGSQSSDDLKNRNSMSTNRPDISNFIPLNWNGPKPVSTIMEEVQPIRPSPNSVFPKAGDKLESPSAPVKTSNEASAPTASLPSGGSFDFLMPPQRADEIGRLGGYRILNVLGEGGMGVVFKAEDPRLKRLVALKVMKPDKSANQVAHERFKKEGETAASISHDHIVTIYQVDEDRGIPFLAMQFLEGESLDERLKRVGKLPASEIIRIARESAEGLGAAHEKGLIHRDIKPANIWLETLPGAPSLGRGLVGGRVKILDFGLARAVGENVQHLTQTGMVVGTPDYMAPEQARSGQVLDCRCDLFSLGSVMYRMSTGRKPFQGDDVMGTLLALAIEDPSPPRFYNPEIPQELSEMIRWMMAKNPADRPRSAQDVLDSLAVIERNMAQGTQDYPELSSGNAKLSGAQPSSRQSTLTAPGIERGVGARSRTDQQPASAPSTLSKFGLTPVDPSQSFQIPAVPVVNKIKREKSPTESRPGPALSPLLKDLVGRTEFLETIRPKIEKCPKCGDERFSSVGWCMACGYSPKVKEDIAGKKDQPINSGWIILGGIVGVVLATAVCHVTLRVAPQGWVRWVWIETGLGLAAMIIGYIWNYYDVLPYYGDHTGNLTWNPLTLFSAGIHMLPKTRWALGLGAWGITAVAATSFFVGDISYLWRFKVQVPVPSSSPIVFEKSDHGASPVSSAGNSSKKKTKSTRTFSVVGYIGSDVVLAHSSIDGTYKYAGRTSVNGSIKEKLNQAKLRTEPVIAGSTLIGVKWIEPFSWEVEYSKFDDNGVLAEPVLK
jgi:serine/threonine protein kinase